MKRCHYDILEVDRKATTAQIKMAYRKMAIKYHPDKNPSEEAKKMFMEVQQSYEVLSDPNQRTFYDNNRQKILFNKDDMSKEDLEQYGYGFNIWPYFSAKCYKGFGDEEGAFYQVYREVFEVIKGQEIKAYKIREEDLDQDIRKYEGFGTSETSQEKVVKFYEDFDNFTTYKSFVWIEEYDLRQAENRWVKRQMQKENKKQRNKEKKNYIKTIKDLVNFVKKRDPRYQQYLMEVAQKQAQKEKERLDRIQAKKKEKQSMKKAKQISQEERFKEIQAYHKAQNNGLQNEDQIQYQYELPGFSCMICKKAFQSANQVQNHEKSKAHKRLVRQIQKQVMLKEQAEAEAKRIANGHPPKQEQKQSEPEQQTQPVKPKKKRFRKKKNKNSEEGKDQGQKQEPKEQQVVEEQPPKKKKKKEKVEVVQSQSSDDMEAFMGMVKPGAKEIQKPVGTGNGSGNTKPKKGKKKNNRLLEVESSSQEQSDDETPKVNAGIGKAKLKKMKKAEQQTQGGLFVCKICASHFPSNSKLFDHIKKTGHAATKA